MTSEDIKHQFIIICLSSGCHSNGCRSENCLSGGCHSKGYRSNLKTPVDLATWRVESVSTKPKGVGLADVQLKWFICIKLVWDCCLIRAHELRESRGGRPGLPVPNSKDVAAEVLHYVHRNRRLIRDRSPGRPPRLSHSS